MADITVRLNRREIAKLGDDSAVGQAMRPRAEQILARARGKAPEWLDAKWYTKAGKGPRGAFAQAIAQGDGAVRAEYGGQFTRASAMFRSST